MATVKIEVWGLRNERGHVLAGLYADKGQWLKARDATLRGATGEPHGREALCRFEDVPPGRYAVAVFHDENDNEKMDANFLGFPKEGFGFSNVERIGFGQPSFDAAAFEVNDEDLTVRAKVHYLSGRST